jgi:hypothetical protein
VEYRSKRFDRVFGEVVGLIPSDSPKSDIQARILTKLHEVAMSCAKDYVGSVNSLLTHAASIHRSDRRKLRRLGIASGIPRSELDELEAQAHNLVVNKAIPSTYIAP